MATIRESDRPQCGSPSPPQDEIPRARAKCLSMNIPLQSILQLPEHGNRGLLKQSREVLKRALLAWRCAAMFDL
jgi:hypothetical protein